MNKSKLIRMLYVLTSLALGVGLVYGLSLAGTQTQGPVETVLNKATDVVARVEQNMILEKREEKRVDKLQWLQAYKTGKIKLTAPDRMLFGAFDNKAVSDFQPLINLEDTLRTTFPILHIYTAWGSKKENGFPKEKVNNILELGSIPSITWEPWLTAFEEGSYPGLRPMAERDKAGLRDIVAGTYDAYVRKWARAARQVKSPIILRWGHEMNDPYRYPWGPQNNDIKEFVAAYRHVHSLFEEEKARNVLWAWSPHPAYGHFREYYPGDSVVDFVAVGTLNYGTVASWSRWWSFDQIFGAYYPGLSAFGKPIILSEFNSLSVGGSRSKWFADAMTSMPAKYPLVRMVLFFHFDNDQTTTQQTLDWSFIHDRGIVKTLKPEVACLGTPGELPALAPFQKAAKKNAAAVENAILRGEEVRR